MALDSAVQTPQRPHRTGKAADIWHVYLLECADGTLYCGITTDLARRLAQHNGLAPGGARYTSGRRPVRLLASRACARKSVALRLECAVKARPRAEKILFLQEGVVAPC
ncbi:GIY-YIG nuclease family protein [Desulfovibrio porci]|uniref:GIY-YIG nuclease family protein n=1 Tax=Desulfovibrio porci TaxID=2605782 RepID=UPI003A8DD60F